jgi:hypothetical protein
MKYVALLGLLAAILYLIDDFRTYSKSAPGPYAESLKTWARNAHTMMGVIATLLVLSLIVRLFFSSLF